MARIIELDRPIRRRIGSLTIRIEREAVYVRGRGRRTWRRIDWDRILSLLESSDHPVLEEVEAATGRRIRTKLTSRRRRVQRMHAVLQCARCSRETDWIEFDSRAEVRRGKPCPNCAPRAGKTQ